MFPDLGYEWDALNRLKAISYGVGNQRTEFSYDGWGRRTQIVEKTRTTVTSTKRFVWIGNDVAEERDGSNNVTKRFFGEGEQIGGTAYLFTRDHLGSVREMVDVSGVVQARYAYDPYGRRTKVSGSLEADFGFTGHYYHAPSQLHLALYRAYDAGKGRWISRDPLGEFGPDGENIYCYVQNSPIIRLDPTGEASIRDWVNGAITACIMTVNSLTGNPAKPPPRPPTVARQEQEQRHNENKKSNDRSRKRRGSARICPIYDPSEDINFILDYDWDKSFQENLRDSYGPGEGWPYYGMDQA